MQSFYHSISLLGLAALSSSVLAEEEQQTQPDNSELDPITVTATRTSWDLGLASTTTITREDIERQQATSIGEVLENLAGIGVSNNGGQGKATSVFIRGTESDHVLVLIDGVKSGSATLGTTAYELIPISEIERIEIVRGPRSSLYGSEAIGGVIQIFTRKAGRSAFSPTFEIGAGSHDSQRASTGFSGRYAGAWYNLHLSHEDTNGFNSCAGSLTSGCYTNEGDNDGFRNEAASMRLGYRHNDKFEVEVHGLYSDGDTHYDGSYQNQTDFVQQIIGARLRYSLFDFWDINVNGGQSRDRSKNKLDGTETGVFNTTRNTFTVQNDFKIFDNHLLSLGWDLRSDKIQSDVDYDRKSREDKAFFAQYQGVFGRHDIVLGARKTDNDQFGHHGTVNVAWGYNFDHGIQFSASYGTAYKAPTFNELYYPYYGNADLQPERSRSIEFSLKGDHSWGNWQLNTYQTKLRNLITYDSSIFAANNVSEARIRGVEAIVSFFLAGWTVTNNLSALEPENQERGSNSGNVLPRRAELMFRTDIDRDFGPVGLGLTLRGEGRRFDDLANQNKLGGYVVLNVRSSYNVTREWQVQGEVNNLLDKQYKTAAGYNTDDTNVNFTVRYSPKE